MNNFAELRIKSEKNTTARFALIRQVLCSIAMILFAVGCGGEVARKNDVVVATVDGAPITEGQLAQEVAQLDSRRITDHEVLSRRVLTALVDRQILAQNALAQQLHHDPRVVSAFRRAKEQILAQAYLERNFGEIERPSQDEIHAYYSAHPELFENRRAYHFQQISVDKGAYGAELRARVEALGSLADIAAFLVSKNISFKQDSSVATAEELPMKILKQIFQLRKGQLFVVHEAASVRINQLAHTIDMPLSRAEAVTIIERSMREQQRKERANNELTRLRAAAEIEFAGTYAEYRKEHPSVQADANYNVVVESGIKKLK